MLAAAVVRLLVFAVTSNEPGDAEARAVEGALTYESPHLIYFGIWLPLHRYTVALFMIPFSDPVLAGKMLSLFAGVAALFPFYHLTRLYFDRRTTLLAGGMFVIFGNHVGLSALVMTETPFVFLSLWGVLLFAREKRSSSPRMAGFCRAALLLALAGGFRQEAWQLSGILMLWMLLDSRIRRYVVPYAAIAFSPFLYWTIGNMVAGEGLLFGLLGVASAKEAELAYVERSALVNVVKWIWIFLQSPGPLLCLFGLVGMQQALVRRPGELPLAAIALLMLAPYVLLSILKPAWAPQHRYVVFAAILLLPYAAAGFWLLLGSSRLAMPAVAVLLTASIATQALAYGRHSSAYLPVKDHQQADLEVSRWLQANLSPLDRLVVEDVDWRAPGIVLRSESYRRPYQMLLGTPSPERLAQLVRAVDATVIVLRSPPTRWSGMEPSEHELVFRSAEYLVFRRKPDLESTTLPLPLFCTGSSQL
jgi:hypothetical protein